MNNDDKSRSSRSTQSQSEDADRQRRAQLAHAIFTELKELWRVPGITYINVRQTNYKRFIRVTLPQ
ncbi:hypothetical protein [Paraburkholderia sp. RL17-337-BIB-A]|uniref:hypothetical protein n=1 Tax=Paraburkholderia sp. RL17-337-BIB-A TaxID=3031636 RepID=UPI0038BE1C60